MSDDVTTRDFGLAILLLPWITLLRGWCFWLLWGWFIAPIGPELSGVAHAVGICAIVGFFARVDPLDRDRSVGELASLALSWMGFTLLVGWIASWWMP